LALLTWLGAIAALVGAVLALVQDRPRRIAGYLVVYNAGMILFGLATITPVGLMGAVFEAFNQMVAVPLLDGIADVAGTTGWAVAKGDAARYALALARGRERLVVQRRGVDRFAAVERLCE
jgi:NADH:ubiquinone oxidoreductase subunit 2 (subunit N)